MLFLTADIGGEVHQTSHEELTDLVSAVEMLAAADGWADDLTFKVTLVVDEIGQNAVDYAYGDGAGDVEVFVTSGDGTLEIEIVDSGEPFDPLTEAPAPDLTSGIEDRPIGGLGVHLTKSLMEDVTYRRESGKNRLKAVTSKLE